MVVVVLTAIIKVIFLRGLHFKSRDKLSLTDLCLRLAGSGEPKIQFNWFMGDVSASETFDFTNGTN